MPVCAVRHCASRSGKRKLENVKLFSFPKDAKLQKQWIDACQRHDGEIKFSKAGICQIHFTPDSFEDKMTQPRTVNVQPRMMRRLKIGSVPTLHLDVCNKKGAPSDSSPASTSDGCNRTERTKSCFTGIPTYAELLTCAKEKSARKAEADLSRPLKDRCIQGHHFHDVEKQDFGTSQAEFCDVFSGVGVSNFQVGVQSESCDINYEGSNVSNIEMTNKGVTSSGLTDTPCLSTIGVETCSGSSQVENVPKENEELRRLTELNKQLAKEMLELQAENKKIKEEREIREKMEIEMHVNLLMEIREKDEQLTGMKKNEENLLNQILGLEREKKRAEKRCLDMKRDAENHEKNTVKRILGKVFTPGQIKVLLSENRARIRWSAEDISSALALRAKSGLAYKYLREVIHIPLPCETVLRDWTANFKVPPGILHSVLGIMKSKGENQTKEWKLTTLCLN